jgi:hypothetical protein
MVSKSISSFAGLVFAGSLCVSSMSVSAQAPRSCDEVFQPQVGQSGKDVIWVPTPDELVNRM